MGFLINLGRYQAPVEAVLFGRSLDKWAVAGQVVFDAAQIGNIDDEIVQKSSYSVITFCCW